MSAKTDAATPVLSETIAPGVRRITLNRPERLNAMNRALIDGVAQAFDAAAACRDTRAIVFTGAGRAFCAGDDRREHVHPEGEAAARDLVAAIQRATRAILGCEKPVVGAIRGWAVGGGFEWAINCDFSIWSEDARAFFPEVSLGLFVTGGVAALLPALVGLRAAREMLMLGQRYTAADLARLGIAQAVVPDAELDAAALALAERLAALPPRSLAAMKRVLGETASGDVERALRLETEACVAGFLDPETTARVTAF